MVNKKSTRAGYSVRAWYVNNLNNRSNANDNNDLDNNNGRLVGIAHCQRTGRSR